MAKKAKSRTVSRREITALVTKLRKWGRRLPVKERRALSLFLDRAKGATFEEDVPRTMRMPVLLETSVARIAKMRPRPWVRGGPVWARG